MKSFLMGVVFAVVAVILLFAPAFGADGVNTSPILGEGFSFADGFSANWNIQNSNDSAIAYFNVEFEYPMLNYANWNFNVREDDTSLWSARLYMSGPITYEELALASSMSKSTSISRNGVQLSQSLNTAYWYNNWENTNTMVLSGNFSLSPASIVKSYFSYNEYSSYDWNGEEWIQGEEPDHWYATLNFDGKFLDTPLASGQVLGASFASVPEPSAIVLLATFCLALGGYCFRRYRR